MGPQHHVRRCGLLWAAIATVAASLVACSDPPSTVGIGFASSPGSQSAADVAQGGLDESHPPGGRRIVVAVGDSTRPSVDALLNEVDRAIRFASNPSIVAVVGPAGSREALQTAPVYRDARLPNVIPIGNSSHFRGLGPLFFLLAPSDSVQGDFIGQFVAEQLRARRVAIMYVPDEYGVGLAAGSEAALRRRRIELTVRMPVRPMQACPPRSPDNDYNDVVADVLGYGAPDVVVLAARSVETACIARAIRERVAGARFVAGDDALVDSSFVALAGPAADSMYLVAFWHRTHSDSASRAFTERFRARVGRDPRHDDAMFYDAVMLTGHAIRNGGASRAAVAKYLGQLGRSRPPYRGITGPIAFTPGAPRPLIMTRLMNGQTEPVLSR